jgi:hypothetical protein
MGRSKHQHYQKCHLAQNPRTHDAAPGVLHTRACRERAIRDPQLVLAELFERAPVVCVVRHSRKGQQEQHVDGNWSSPLTLYRTSHGPNMSDKKGRAQAQSPRRSNSSSRNINSENWRERSRYILRPRVLTVSMESRGPNSVPPHTDPAARASALSRASLSSDVHAFFTPPPS